MGEMKRYAEDLAEKLATEFCRRKGIPETFEIVDAAFMTITSGPEADSQWDEPWVLEWLQNNKNL